MIKHKWEKRMLQIAKVVATFSKDPSTQVGAVIYNPERRTIITTGYNGFPRGTRDDAAIYEDREQKYPRVVHAEANAIVEAAAQGISTSGSYLATTHTPCCDCAGLLIQAGITSIVYEDTEDTMARLGGDMARDMLKEACIPLIGITL
jgi:dCMP deaminase